MPDFHFADVFFVHFAADVILAGGNREELCAFGDQLAIDGLDVRQQTVHRRTDLGILHLRLELLRGFIERRQIAIALDPFRLEQRLEAVHFAPGFFKLDLRHVAQPGQFFEPAQIVLGHLQRFRGRQGQFRALRRRLEIGARLFQLPRRGLVGDRGEQLAFLDVACRWRRGPRKVLPPAE